ISIQDFYITPTFSQMFLENGRKRTFAGPGKAGKPDSETDIRHENNSFRIHCVADSAETSVCSGIGVCPLPLHTSIVLRVAARRTPTLGRTLTRGQTPTLGRLPRQGINQRVTNTALHLPKYSSTLPIVTPVSYKYHIVVKKGKNGAH